MSEGLIALQRLQMFPIYQQIRRMPQQFRDRESIKNDLHLIERELKALEIIKAKGVDVGWLIKTQTISEYNNVVGTVSHKALIQEEYDLLKEVLG